MKFTAFCVHEKYVSNPRVMSRALIVPHTMNIRVNKKRLFGYEVIAFPPQLKKQLLRRSGQKGHIIFRTTPIRCFPAQNEVTMLESLTTAFSTQAIAFGVLLMGCGIVVVEAVRSSREVLWGDMFMDDLDD
ncbi:hypothetical protein [Hyphomonas pacifica]|nr:hypothetical protein [Hyphomonas pacifica]